MSINAECGVRSAGSLVIRGALLVGLLGAAGCDKITSAFSPPAAKPAAAEAPEGLPSRPFVSQEDVLAKVNGKVISARDIELTLQDLKATTEALGQAWEPLASDRLRDVLDELVLAELRAQDSVARGLDRKTETQAKFWYRYRNFFAQEWVGWQLDQVKFEVTPEEVEQFYKANQRGFREPERIRVRQLVVDSEDKAKTALVKLLEGMDCVTVAQQMSLRPDAAQGPMVDRQWVMRGAEKAAFAADHPDIRALDPALEQAAFAIDQAGGVSSYVKGADGNFHIFQLVERREGQQKPLTDVADGIRNYLRLQKLADKSEALRKGAKVETFPERLVSLEPPGAGRDLGAREQGGVLRKPATP